MFVLLTAPSVFKVVFLSHNFLPELLFLKNLHNSTTNINFCIQSSSASKKCLKNKQEQNYTSIECCCRKWFSVGCRSELPLPIRSVRNQHQHIDSHFSTLVFTPTIRLKSVFCVCVYSYSSADAN